MLEMGTEGCHLDSILPCSRWGFHLTGRISVHTSTSPGQDVQGGRPPSGDRIPQKGMQRERELSTWEVVVSGVASGACT